MKTCPKCNRSYDDETLNFCLDDGEWLLSDEPESEDDTNLFSSSEPESEAPTRQKIQKTDETAILPTDAIKRSSLNTGTRRPMRVLFGATVGLFVFLAAGYGLFQWYSGSSDSTEALPEIEEERLTGDGQVLEAAISPDGKFLAYLEVKDEKSSLLVKQIETNSTVEILKEGEFQDINNVIFSPDGNHVYFAGIDPDRKRAIYRVPTLGGSPAMIPLETMVFSISPDGASLAYYGDDAETTETHISLADPDGSNARKILSKAGKTWVEPGTTWSPDGKHLVLVQGDDDRLPEPELSLAVYSFEDGSTRDLGSIRWERIDDKGLVWDPSGKFVYLTGRQTAGDTMQIWRISFPDGEAVRLTRNRKNYWGLSITSDGSRVVTTENEVRSGIWVSPDLDPMNSVEVLPARGDTWSLDWTPDGRIVYVSDQSGAPEVWMMNADGSEQKQLTNDRIVKLEPAVSPDGEFVVYYSPVDGFQLYKVPIGGGLSSRIATGQIGPSNPDFSKDGKHIVFSAWTGGKQGIYRIPAAGGNSERLTDYPSTEPSYSPDGSAIACFYFAKDARFPSIAIIPATGGSPLKSFDVPATTATYRGPVWTPDGKQITYIVSNGEKRDLWAQPVIGGDPVRLTDFDRPWIARRSYSRDGKRVAVTRAEGFRNVLMLKGLK
ncbi:MAG TPA: hypothetical protein VMM38_01150 [Aridibacter sp.]|nr:hypothetical protein [Aridibacter sp.]